eukprot:SAG31_NODE_26696_length_438_cov_0.607670_1_plen_44_part_10
MSIAKAYDALRTSTPLLKCSTDGNTSAAQVTDLHLADCRLAGWM